MEGESTNWSESVEDLVQAGDIDQAISLLESVVSKVGTTQSSSEHQHLQLSSALFELAMLYSTKGFSLKADETRSRALLIKQQGSLHASPQSGSEAAVKESTGSWALRSEPLARNRPSEDGCLVESSELPDNDISRQSFSDDEWEAIADRAPDELLSLQCLPEVSKLSLGDTKVETLKRRGRGTFTYRRHGLYSDQESDGPIFDVSENGAVSHSLEGDSDIRVKYGTRHVLVLANFVPSTTTADLEKLLEDFKDQGVVIRWINDTTALAVFRSPSIALEALNCIQCAFTVRLLDENDELLSSIPTKDLEPPRRRPETSTRAAQRLIAQGMGMKLPSSAFGSKELRKQEEARRNRIVTRQIMKDQAWGEDAN